MWNGISFSQFELEEAFPSLRFTNPVDLQNSGDATNRIFVVEQAGRIIVFKNNSSISASKVFLDITDKVTDGGEMGLLGLAFHPQYTENGYFYVNYTKNNPRQTIVARYKVTDNPDSADKNSEVILMTINQPYSNHNGGQIAFGPDGCLYIALGDGGSFGDPQNNAQNLQSFLGKILRINVDTTSGNINYGIPPDNPFINDSSALPEIFAYGLRNPWRFSFDSTGKLWCGDVGQGDWEEIDTITIGGNYGWRIMEGTHCYNPSSNCDTSGLILPIHEYAHNSQGGGSITGGYVYEGTAVPELKGRYIFADYISRRIWSLGYYGINPDLPIVEQLATAQAGISSFGVDENNELYLCSFDGKIYRFKSTVSEVEDDINLNDYQLLPNYPNPFNPETTLQYILPEKSKIKIEIINLTGSIIEKILDAVQSAGKYNITWNGAENSSGIYYAKLTAESLVSGKKIQKSIKLALIK